MEATAGIRDALATLIAVYNSIAALNVACEDLHPMRRTNLDGARYSRDDIVAPLNEFVTNQVPNGRGHAFFFGAQRLRGPLGKARLEDRPHCGWPSTMQRGGIKELRLDVHLFM